MWFPDDDKIRVCLDAEYAHSDTDEVLKVCAFQEEATEFADEWATKQAEKMLAKSDPDFEAMKRIYKKQLCYYNFDNAPKSKCLTASKVFFNNGIGKGRVCRKAKQISCSNIGFSCCNNCRS